ncbi:hypothetical protein ABEB36_008556 [Hypothenemus hampei]|uniref:NOL1/NOP2/Sun domain family member 4 n=1 Tax=Hypothenemus hampei TaxID=57062 RepID=A0ABD1EMA4_HYPHA
MFSYSVLKQFNEISKIFVRYKNPRHHWSVQRKKIHPVDKALAHFDDFYREVFQKKWPSIREGLLGKQKYVAVVNNYGDSDETMAHLELTGALNIRRLFNLEKEYIREQVMKNERNTVLERIWKMDRESEQLSNIAPNSQVATACGETNYHKHSLQASLDSAEIDSRRIIDSKNSELSLELLNEFIPATKVKGNDDFIMESEHYKMFDATLSFQKKKECDIHFPENLNIYCYEMDNFSDFEASKTASTGVLNYYLMDGGSILPVLALDLKPDCNLLDVCAAPGGKSLLALQTLYPHCVVSNDVSMSRTHRIENVYQQFLYDFKERWLDPGRVKITCYDGRCMPFENFDRILVDVPCTTDRHSLKENDNNIFKPDRIKERLKLPELQAELLFSALKLVKKGGIVVYSTCSLSPIQNDGVINMALKKIWEETQIEIIVKDLTAALLQTHRVFELASTKLLKYGHLVIPQKGQNYGPTYFCKLQRIK